MEALQNKFPVEILNEIRAVFSHIAKIYVCDNTETAQTNLIKAQGHMKRAQLDAFKYMCYAYSKYYSSFRDLYKKVDLSRVNNGEFIVSLSKLYNDAVTMYDTAKRSESEVDDVIEAYEDYENAYRAYTLLYKCINDNLTHIYKLQQVEQLKQEDLDKNMDEIKAANTELQNTINNMETEITAFQEKISGLEAKITQLNKDNAKERRKSTILTVISIILGIASVVFGIMALG